MAYAAVSETTLASDAELEAIATVRSKLETELKALKDAGKDFPHTTGDIFFTRLIRGNNGNIDEAVEWYKNFIQLRAKYGLDEIHQECMKKGTKWKVSDMPNYEEIKKYMNTNFDAETMRCPGSGHLLWYDAMGDSRTQEMLKEMPAEKILKFFHTTFERRTSILDELSRKEGKIIKILRVMDAEGIGFFQLNRQWSQFEKEHVNPVLMGTSIETVQLVFLPNFPNIFLKAFEIIKLVIPPRLLARFRLLGSDYMQDKEYLAEVGLKIDQELVALNRSHKTESPTGLYNQYDGTDQAVPAGLCMERVLDVLPGQKVSWDFTIGKGEDSNANAGFFSKMASKFSGSEVVFSVGAMWTDIAPKDMVTCPAKVRSAGADAGDSAEFWVDGKKLDYAASTGVNIVAVDLATKAVTSSKAYDMSKAASDGELVKDIAALPRTTMVLMAVKGTGAEELSKDAWDALEGCGACLKEGHWHKGYALVGTKFGHCVSEARGSDVVAEGPVPCKETMAEFVPAKEVSIDSGAQTGSCTADRGGMVVLRWSNTHAMMANKALAKYKITIV